MKVIIWSLCIFVAAGINTFLNHNGIRLGALPTVLLYGSMMWLARTLCKKWDIHKINKQAEKNGTTAFEVIRENIPPFVWEECEEHRCDHAALISLLKGYCSRRTISPAQKEILYNEFICSERSYFDTQTPPTNKEARFCRHCGTPRIENGRFCNHCGTAYEET